MLKTTSPLIVFLPLSSPKAKISETWTQQQSETQEHVVKGAQVDLLPLGELYVSCIPLFFLVPLTGVIATSQLPADYAGIPVLWISNETSETETEAFDNMNEHKSRVRVYKREFSRFLTAYFFTNTDGMTLVV